MERWEGREWRGGTGRGGLREGEKRGGGMEPTSKKTNEGRNVEVRRRRRRGRGGEGRKGRGGREWKGLRSCKNSLKYGLQ